MTQNNSNMFLRRLVVTTHTGAIAYDQKFHKGVNIIRGQNSSGKSSIANLIFYVLGGDFNNWSTVTLLCRDVYAEVELNNALATIKREINERGTQPMSIYWGGDFESSSADTINWKTYPYKQTSKAISFSNVLFNALSFPEVKSDESNITMHQLLRLMYIDQDTATLNLFRYENFDLPLTRQVVSELMMGVYDDVLYNLRLELRQFEKDLDSKKREYEGIKRIYRESGNALDTDSVDKEILKVKEGIDKITKEIDELKLQSSVRTTKNTKLNSEKIQKELIEVKREIKSFQSLANAYSIDIEDSKHFIKTLEKRIGELDNSLITKKVIGDLPLTNCPQCLQPIATDREDGNCHLCKEPITEEIERANAKRLRQEMVLQLKESKKILEEKEEEQNGFILELPSIQEKGRALQKELDRAVESQNSTRDQRIDELLVNKGGLEKQIDLLLDQKKIAENLEILKKEVAELTAALSLIKISINEKVADQELRLRDGMNLIRKITKLILREDLARQEEFKNGQVVDVNFKRDSYSLDESNNFSASSKTYFKNSILFSIFFASLGLDFFRYPRFILCDNMEDKGMEKERTQNLQNLIVRLSEESDRSHQIIFTTSMISDELDNSSYCVGEAYDITNKTLKV